jgi:Uncharacterised nucleotidyltransferase
VTRVPRELWQIVCRLATSREWPPQGDADIAAFFDHVNRHKLLPLLMADEDLPSALIAAKARFRALDALYRRRYELNRDGALELRRVLGPEAFLFFKGSDYRHRVYDRPEQRAMTDIDVYVPSRAFAAAVQTLRDAGYPRKYDNFGAAFLPWHYEISVLVAGVHVEIHQGFSQRVRAAIDYDGMWQRRERFDRDGVDGYRLSPADALLVHAFGLAKDEFGSDLNRFLDFYLLLQNYQGELDQCVKRAKAWQIERPFFGALHLVTAMFPDAKTAAVSRTMDALLDPSTRGYLATRVLPDRTTEPGGASAGQVTKLRRKFGLIDRRWRKVAFVADHIQSTAMGLVYEWRVRRSGMHIPSRSTVRSR